MNCHIEIDTVEQYKRDGRIVFRQQTDNKLHSLDLNLKSEQELAVKKLYAGNDVLAVLPTGFGRSGIFQAFARLLGRRKSRWCHVVSYLATKQHHRLEDKLADLRSRGFIASSLQPDELKNNCDAEIVVTCFR